MTFHYVYQYVTFNVLFCADDANNDLRIKNSDEDIETIGETIDVPNTQYLQCILQEDNYKNCIIEDSRSMTTINQLDEHDDS